MTEGATLSWAGDLADGTVQIASLTYRLGADTVVVEADGDVVSATLTSDGVDAAPWQLRLHVDDTGVCHVDEAAITPMLRRFYGQRLFDADAVGTAVFERATASMPVTAERVSAYRALSRQGAGHTVPLNMGFSLAWRALFQVLADDALIGGFPRLVHLDNTVTPTGGALAVGDTAIAEARVVEVDTAAAGTTITTLSTITADGQDDAWAEVRSRFFIRPNGDAVAASRRAEAPLSATPRHRRRSGTPLSAGSPLARLGRRRRHRGGGHADPRRRRSPSRLQATTATSGAHGALRRGDELVANIDLSDAAGLANPLRVVADALSGEADDTITTPRRTLAEARDTAPVSSAAWADVSLDKNPIHTSPAFAQLNGLDTTIVHGMWSAARLYAFAVGALADGDDTRVGDYHCEFLAPLAPGQPIVLRAVRTGLRGGDLIAEVTMFALRDGAEAPIARATARLSPPRTAYIFPGQGIQRQGMGLQAMERSAAARAVWQRADAFTVKALGFSILHVVRDNPVAIDVGGERHAHPEGVLHLTQFTQVAMAVLAQAQVAELREGGALAQGAVTCGHSVGEYNAISAITQAVPFEVVIEVVWQRGMTMHTYVARGEDGRSNYAMGVIRPHHAGMDHAAAEALVEAIREQTGGFIEIVNYNIKNRQYSVTGHRAALAALQQALSAKAKPGGKAPYVPVPGIDVPFHSSALAPGVPAFRETLESCFDADGPYVDLVGRYVPNLIAQPFALTRDYVETIVTQTNSTPLTEVLAAWDRWSQTPNALARVVLIELLAWQFASPVRWIETQDVLIGPPSRGGLGVARVVELGVGYQPTTANMMKATLAGYGLAAPSVEVFNVDADADRVLCRDADPAPVADEAPAADVATPAPDAAVSAPPVAPAAAPVAAPGAEPISDRPMDHAFGLKALLAVQAKVRPDQISDSETIDALFDGVSSRRNQVLMDIGAEFDLGTIDGAHETPIGALAGDIAKRAPGWRCPGTYLRTVRDEGLRRALGPSGVGKNDAATMLETRFGLGLGLTQGTLLSLALITRPGESARGGDLGSHPDPAGSKTAAKAMLDAAVASVSATIGEAIPRIDQQAGGGGGGGVVDAAAVNALEDRLLGPKGALNQQLDALATALGKRVDDGSEAPSTSPEAAADAEALATLRAEYGADWHATVAPRFEAAKHVAFGSAWAWAQRDVARLYFSGEPDAAAAARLALHAGDARVADTARWFATAAAGQGRDALAQQLTAIAAGDSGASAPFTPTRPRLTLADDGSLVFDEVADSEADAVVRVVEGLLPNGGEGQIAIDGGGWNDAFRADLVAGASTPLDFAGKTALITGASPGSIAVEVVRHVLRGGGRAVVTTSTYNKQRLSWYQRFFQREAGPGAELHVVPANLGSMQDVDAVVDWLTSEITEQNGPDVRVLKPALVPDFFVPFAAVKDMATLDGLGARAEASLRVMLLSAERMLGRIAKRGAGGRRRAPLPRGAAAVAEPRRLRRRRGVRRDQGGAGGVGDQVGQRARHLGPGHHAGAGDHWLGARHGADGREQRGGASVGGDDGRAHLQQRRDGLVAGDVDGAERAQACAGRPAARRSDRWLRPHGQRAAGRRRRARRHHSRGGEQAQAARLAERRAHCPGRADARAARGGAAAGMAR